MKKRSRSRQSSRIVGYTEVRDWVTKEWLRTDTYQVGKIQYMDDYIGKTVRKDGPLQGFLPPSNLDNIVEERYPLYWSADGTEFRIRNLPIHGHYSSPTPQFVGDRTAENQDLAQELMARSSPLRPEFSVPVFLKEFLELSQILKFTFESLTKFTASSYLNYRFGVMPLVNDIRTLSKITTSIEDRIKEFSSLFQVGGLQKRERLSHFSESFSGNDVLFSSVYGTLIYADWSQHQHTTVHGTLRWTPTEHFLLPIDGLTAFNKAARTVLDIDQVDIATMWQVLPFSWLIDYVYDLSSALEAFQDQIYIVPHDICITRTYKTDTWVKRPRAVFGMTPTFSGKGFYRTTRTVRDVVIPTQSTPVLSSILTLSQWKALSALILSWSKKGSRRRTYAGFIDY